MADGAGGVWSLKTSPRGHPGAQTAMISKNSSGNNNANVAKGPKTNDTRQDTFWAFFSGRKGRYTHTATPDGRTNESKGKPADKKRILYKNKCRETDRKKVAKGSTNPSTANVNNFVRVWWSWCVSVWGLRNARRMTKAKNRCGVLMWNKIKLGNFEDI